MKEDIELRVKKVKGIVEGVQKMIYADTPWDEVAQQIRAAYGALRRAELRIIQADLEGLIAKKAGSDEVKKFMDRMFKSEKK